MALSMDTGLAVQRAQAIIEEGDLDTGFNQLLKLVAGNRGYYPLLMAMGFVYLRWKGNLSYAMKYFEKAAGSPPTVETNHYRVLALQFLASCHESQQRYKNALAVLQRAESAVPEDPSVAYSIARIYGFLDKERSAIDYMERALKNHPAFYTMALVDPAFETVRGPLESWLREQNKTFRKLARRFDQLIGKVLDVYESWDLHSFVPALDREMDRVGRQREMVRAGYYQGYREGIRQFYLGSFPEAVQTLQNVLLKKRKVDRRTDSLKRARRRKRARIVRWIITPPFMAVSAGSVWWYQWPVLERIPIAFPMMQYTLPGLAAVVALLLVLILRKNDKKDAEKAEERFVKMERAALQVENFEKNLRNFWLNEVAPNVNVVPLWVKSDSVSVNRPSRRRTTRV
jgi:tetratricopeptide (TPR) repeat protein